MPARAEQDQEMIRRDGQPRVLQAEPEYDHGDVGDEESEAKVHEVISAMTAMPTSLDARTFPVTGTHAPETFRRPETFGPWGLCVRK